MEKFWAYCLSCDALSKFHSETALSKQLYPPRDGGVGRYTFNLVNEIKKSDCEVLVLCDQKWNEDYKCVSPFTEDNSNIILKAVEDVKPDVIHIQFEPGLYG